jgi:CRP/FNR family transcriptional regulator, cyclic AMP receptor protein
MLHKRGQEALPMHTQDRQHSMRSLIEGTGLPYTAVRFEPRETIFHQGDDADTVLYIESGRIELAAVAPSGKEAICGLLGTAAFLGEEALGDSATRPHTATAMIATDVLILSRATMSQLLSSQREFSEAFIAHTVNRTARLTADLADQLLYSCEERLAHVLMVLADADDRDPLRYRLPNVTQEFIARMVGTTRSRVNHFLGKFKKVGFVEEHDGVLHLNPAMLVSVPGGLAAVSPDMRGLRSSERYQ